MRAGPAALLVGGVAYSLIAASTRAFTLPADVLTGLAILAMAVVVIVRWPLHTRSVGSPSSISPAPVGPGDAATTTDAANPARPSHAAASSHTAGATPSSAHPYLLWLLLLMAFVVWELFNYLVHGTRANHPTFSSITDANDRFYILKALLFLGWMAAGWVIIGRGTQQRAARPARQRPAKHGPGNSVPGEPTSGTINP